MLYESINISSNYSLNTITTPISVYMKITSKCMLKCIFCSQSDNIIQEMDFGFAKEMLRKFKSLGIQYVYYTGGEPLLFPHICELIEYGNSLGMKQVLVTNGLLFTQKKYFNILKYISTVGISLHGTPHTHNTLVGDINCYDIVTKNITRIREAYPKINIDINYTFLNKNCSVMDLDHIASFAQSVNATFCIGRLNYIANGKNYSVNDNLIDLLDYISHAKYSRIKLSNCIAPCLVPSQYRYLLHSCGVGISLFAVEPNGDVKICPSSQKVIGNLKKQSFSKIWNSSIMKKFRKLEWQDIGCKSCKFFPNCKGGCHSEGTQNFWSESCDALYLLKKELLWSEICSSPVYLKYTEIRKEGFNRYLVLSFPAKLIDKDAYEILKLVNGCNTGTRITNLSSNRETKDLLIALYKDGLIGVKNEK